MKKNAFIKISSAALSAALICTAMVPACAYSNEENTPKEEVVYVNLNGDGSVKGIYVVNIFDLNSDGQIVDYGEYESISNMTTRDDIQYSNDTVKINAKKGKLYYEGRLSSDIMPWNISIRYFMNGKEYTSNEIAGKSGKLEIKISIIENAKCKGNFFDGYALQASLSLNTNKCTNIISEGATTANVGSNKQLTYTVLPGKGADYTITANVCDFEMSEISVNGVPLALDIDVDNQELTDKIAELTDAVKQLDDGAVEIDSGIIELQDRVKSDLYSGANKLSDGAGELNNGTAALKNGGESLQNGASILKNGAETLDNGINSINDGIKQINNGLKNLNEKSTALKDGSEEFKSALSLIQAELNNVKFSTEDLKKLTDASSKIKNGIDNLTENAVLLHKSVSFESYKNTMKSNGLDIDVLYQNNTALIHTLSNNLDELNTEIAELKAQGEDTSYLEEQTQQIYEMIKLITANNAAIDGTDAYLTAINENIGKLSEGIKTLKLNYEEFNLNISELADTLSGMIYNLSALSGAIDTLVTEYSKLDRGINEYTDGVAQIVTGFSQIASGTENLVSGSSQLKSGTDNLDRGAKNLMSGITELYDGSISLKNGTADLDNGVIDLLNGICELKDGSGKMKDGTSQMLDETSEMNIKITDKIDDMIADISGDNVEVQSFVSDSNTNVNTVQFVIKSEKIKYDEESEEYEIKKENKNFWQKLISLFGIDKE